MSEVWQIHEWINPEIAAIPLAAGLALYVDWVDRTTRL